MYKKMICFLVGVLAGVFLLTAAALAAGSGTAADPWQIGSPNEADVLAFLDNGTLCISGTGAICDFTSDSMPWYSRRTEITAVRIDSGVTRIGDYALYYLINAATISIPSTVESCGTYAFRDCRALTDISLPEGFAELGPNAFYMCTGLVSVDLPSTLTTIGQGAFSSCDALESLDVPAGVTAIPNNFASGCGKLKTVTLHPGITSIGEGAFQKNTSLSAITIPSTVTQIGKKAFQQCEGLTEAVIPSSVKTIGESAFYKCSGLKKVVLSEGVTTVGTNAFGSCTSLTSVDLPSTLTSVNTRAFNQSNSISEVTVRSAVPGDYAAALSVAKNSLTAIYVPAGTDETYKTASGWSAYADKIFGAYLVSVETAEHGSVAVSRDCFPAKDFTGSETVTVTVMPDAGYELKSLTWRTPDASDGTDFTSAKSFTMPKKNVTVSAKFARNTLSVEAVSYEGAYDGKNHMITWTVKESGAEISDASVYLRESGDTDWVPAGDFTPYTDAGSVTVEIKAQKDGYMDAADSAAVNISKRPVTVTSGITAADRGYIPDDRSVTLITANAVLDGRIDGDNLSVSAVGTMADDSAGNGKPVTVSDLALGGTDAANYVLAASGHQAETTVNISMSASAVSVAPKANVLIFNGTAQALVTEGTAVNGTMNYALGTDGTTAPSSGWSTEIPTAIEVGEYYVWYKSVGNQNFSDSAPLAVTAKITGIPVEIIIASPDTLTLKPGENRKITVTVRPENASDKSLTWTADIPDVVSVSEDGTVTGLKEGNAKVTATASNGVNAAVTVTVRADVPIHYTMIFGANQTILNTQEARFASDADFSKFTDVLLDGKVLNGSSYTAKSGSTVIILKPELVRTLNPGVHILRIVSADGYAETKFTVRKLPKTGDAGRPLLWTGCLIFALAGAVMTVRRRKISK